MRDHAIVLARCALVFLSGGTCIGLLRTLLRDRFPLDGDVVNGLGVALACLLLYAATRPLRSTPPTNQ